MYCSNCGAFIEEKDKLCEYCGKELKKTSYIGYSDKINDKAFDKYTKDTKRWAWIFSAILAVIAVSGFYIYGETSPEMDNPEALYIGFVIGGMFLLIALMTIISRNRSETWDGMVTGKEILEKWRNVNAGNSDYYWEEYLEYIIIIMRDNGDINELSAEDDDTLYNYYKVGDKVRHHKNLNSFEKYDKSQDTIIFCNACASLNDINDERCFRCKCPLLK
ncbi:MAG: zinc ribbon domain-containing protein [Sedimentibacter sp.]